MALEDYCILWNKLGSDSELTNSEIGQDGVEWGNLSYPPVKHGNGAYSNNVVNWFTFPNGTFNPDKFIVEYWMEPDGWNVVNGVADDPPQPHQLFAWYFNSANFINIQYEASNGLWFNVRVGGVNNAHYLISSDLDHVDGVPGHYVFIYNRDGIAGGSNTKRLYFNGTLINSTDSIPASQINVGTMYFLRWASAFNSLIGAEDNLKIYNPAATESQDIIDGILDNRDREDWPPVGGYRMLDPLRSNMIGGSVLIH